jgi:hypothetical protein
VSEAAEFIDAALQLEASWSQAIAQLAREAPELEFYGASIGAIRGTLRNAERRYPNLDHDEITALSSELWARPVFERRLAAIILLQANVALLRNSDLTRIEGFVRSATLAALAGPLAADVIRPMLEQLDAAGRAKADVVLDRWAADADPWLRRAADLARPRD